MNKRVIFGGGAIVLLVLWLLRVHHTQQSVYAPATKVASVPQMNYVVGGVVTDPPNPLVPHGALFDWFNGDQCGCDDLAGQDALYVTSVHIAPRTQPGYTYIPNVDLTIPPALKGVPTLVRNYPMPDPITYVAATPTFWWGWKGLSRVIYTSDGFTLSMATQDKGGTNRAAGMSYLWKDITPGRNALSAITLISYDGQEYRLDASRSVGL